jgi:membrane fusion protein, heavy metal efflux system
MKRIHRRPVQLTVGVCLSLGFALWVGLACDAQSPTDAAHDAPENGAIEPSERGPHGGRLFESESFGLELTLFETDVPPEFRAYVYQNGEPRDLAGVTLEVRLNRLSGRTDQIRFSPREDYLVGDREVSEPHSFDVEVIARDAADEYRFAYASHENRVVLSPEQVGAAGIVVERAGPATIRELRPLSGRVVANEDALAHMAPRFPGVVRSVHKRLGDSVAKGDLLAVIESNESLHAYELRSQVAGSVLARDVSPGEFVSTDRPIFTIGDLGTVWVDLDVYRRDFSGLARGQRVWVDPDDGAAPVESTLAYLAPIGSVSTQTLLARVVLANAEGRWRPGQFVSARVLVAEVPAAVAVRPEAIQRVRDWDVVFIADGNTFEAQPVVLGSRDESHVEVVSGLAAGTPYAASGSFILKAEAGKSGAGHDE